MRTEPSVPLVSVLVVAYNQEEMISDCLDSILAQKVAFPFEVLVGEDYSSDDTRKIVERYEREYPSIRGIYHSENQGLMRNYYDVIEQCRGTYIAVCAGDDFWHDPQKLAMQVDVLEGNPSVGLVCSEYDILKDDNRTPNWLTRSNIEVPVINLFEELLFRRSDFIAASTVCFRHELYTTYVDFQGYLKKGFMMEDWPMWLEFSLHSTFEYLPQSLVTRRILRGSLSSHTCPEKRYQFIKSAFEIVKHFSGQNEKVSPEMFDSLSRNYNRTFLFYAYKLRRRDIADAASKHLLAMGHRFTLQDRLSILAAKYFLCFVLLKILKRLGLLNQSYLSDRSKVS